MTPVEITTLLRIDEELVDLADAPTFSGTWSHVPGAIELRVHAEPIMDQAWWDDVDWLWPFLVRVIDDLLASGEAEILYPSQPITLRMRALGSAHVLITTQAGEDRRQATCAITDLVGQVQRAGRAYWAWLESTVGSLSPGDHEARDTLLAWRA